MIKISKEKKVSKTYQKIIKAALPVFALKGFNETTLDEVVKIAGVGKGTIYNHFKNKEDLFRHIIEISTDELFEKLTQTFDIDAIIEMIHEGKVNKENYKSVCSQQSQIEIGDWHDEINDSHPMVISAKNYFSYALINPDFFIILLKTMGEIKNNRSCFIKELFTRKIFEKKLNVILDAEIKHKKLKNLPPETIVFFILSTFNSFVYHWLLNDQKEDMNEYAIIIADLIVNGIRYRD